ncbi:MAG: hypothetical protein WCT85_02575 [Parachlamydiales bacterium]|jgi:hypothetical protein
MKLKLEFFKNNYDSLDEENHTHHANSLKGLAKKILPEEFFHENPNEDELKKAQLFLTENIPILKWSKIEKGKNLSILLMCKHRKNATSFFYDMITRWLIPQKKINIELFFSSDFVFLEIDQEKFTIMEAIINIETDEELEIIEKNKRIFETEMRLGIVSDFHANRITEFKGLSSDRKTAMVQEKIGSLMQKRPKEFGKNIFSEMQHFLIMSRDEFKSQRDYHHISRIISILYMIRKILKQNIYLNPDKRHVILKFLKTKLILPTQGEKTVLGVLVGLNFLKEHEIFEKKQLINAIKHFLPEISFVENSYFFDKTSKNEIQTSYIEVEKNNGNDFALQEINMLKESLPTFLKGSIEQLIHPVFMPRNEEEIVKNILVLSQQIKYVHDIPQVIISFDKQTYNDVTFNVILLRVLKPNDISIKELLLRSKGNLKIIQEKVKKVGVVRRKYLKEANVIRVSLESAQYLRSDNTVDINRARQDVLVELNNLFGEVRDYNGGMIHKQNESYKLLKSQLGEIGNHYDSLLEKYFYSITPAEMTAIVKQEVLKDLFLMLINAIKREETRIKKHSDFLFKQGLKQMYIVIPLYDPNIRKKIKDDIDNMNILSSEIISFYLTSHDISYLGCVLLSEEKAKQKMLLDIIKQNLN